MEDGEFTCTICGTHFTNEKTLKLHMAAIHPSVVKDRGDAESNIAGSSDSTGKRPREAADDTATPAQTSENVELEPLLGVLSDAQKDALILRAIQRDPSFYERILEQASMPLVDDAANARIDSLGPEGVGSAVRWFVTIGVHANALSLLVAASERCLGAIEALADCPGDVPNSSGSAPPAASDDEDDEAGARGESRRETLLRAVESLPAAGSIGALWSELLKLRRVRQLISATGDEIAKLRLLLEGLHAAATTVRASAPALLVGPGGEKVETIREALERLEAVHAEGAAGGVAPVKKKLKA